jgi:AcrR family transcriptional regulator
MGRRSDHSRAELERLILDAGRAVMAAGGLARFSAREVAKRIGYSIGTVHNTIGNFDRLVATVNSETFGLWADHLRGRLAKGGDDRIAALVDGYFGFARRHTNLWSAIYEHRIDADQLTDADHARRAELTGIVVDEVARALGRDPDPAAVALARSLIATVHGHCAFELSGSWALLGEAAADAAALARVREAIRQQLRA